MTIILLPHIMLLLIDGPEIPAILMRLRLRDLTIPAFIIDPPFLIILPSVNLINSGVILQMGRLMTRPLRKRYRNDKHGYCRRNKRFHN